MKAVSYDHFDGPEVLEYLDLPDPTSGSRQLLIETAAIGVNFPDIRERLGVYNKADTRVGGVQLPQVGGLAVAGTVDGLKAGQITPKVDEVLPLSQDAEAHPRLESREVRGVIVLDPTIES